VLPGNWPSRTMKVIEAVVASAAPWLKTLVSEPPVISV
jgi:hypothetical protein